MIEGVYKWVGLVVGGLCALLAISALIQELLGASPDPGSVAFDLVFDVLGAVLSFIGLVAGIFNVVGWLFVVAFVVIGVPHAYWGFIRPAGRS